MLCMVPYPRRTKSGPIPCYLIPTYHVLTTTFPGSDCPEAAFVITCAATSACSVPPQIFLTRSDNHAQDSIRVESKNSRSCSFRRDACDRRLGPERKDYL